MRVLDITEEVWAAKKRVYILPTGVPEEAWEDYIDFKQYRLDFDLVEVEGSIYRIGKWGLGDEILPPKEVDFDITDPKYLWDYNGGVNE